MKILENKLDNGNTILTSDYVSTVEDEYGEVLFAAHHTTRELAIDYHVEYVIEHTKEGIIEG